MPGSQMDNRQRAEEKRAVPTGAQE